MEKADISVESSLARISAEIDTVIARLVNGDTDALAPVLDLIAAAPRVFVLGAGRSGLALRMTAMRLMHLGIEVHVVGEVTTPAIAEQDLLVTASGSGTTAGILRAAQTAADAGAKVAAITTAPDSPLAQLATATIVVPAATKLDRSETASTQYSGSLFEQVVVVLGDALFDALWKRSGLSADELWPRHANLE
ncbi:6-phospho-3-hexuloisomerase [Frigoribacterium sp. CG_9.8]|uniref:6-phospho-3-hexuloisomerase n=1 Tax=Frigoribacterium sp. CG_9.8 TaxID=2787733 RepID=UPI0018CA3086|nr:6-phospho-3-hexuloisomerase [Frigoribacterium sp. CG_9.8]MBG6107521.1 6-phospho-3-hexuloisomerase [Frigoribacterium sp. CG_9.8]